MISLVPEERPDLDRATRRKRQLLRDLDCSIEVGHVDQVIAAELLLGFGKRAVTDRPLTVAARTVVAEAVPWSPAPPFLTEPRVGANAMCFAIISCNAGPVFSGPP